jgi:hypothetical protein
VALDSDGDFVVVWHSFGGSGTDANGFSIQGQRYDSSGTPQGSQFQVNSYTTSDQSFPAVALDSDGDFVVVWQSFGSYGTDAGSGSIQGQRYDSSGAPQGSQFQVNSYTTNDQGNPAVALDSDGDFVVVWHSFGSSGDDNDGHSIQGRAFLKSGLPLWGEFQINRYTLSSQLYPAVALDSNGDFVVAWQSGGSPGDDNSNTSIQAGLFDLGQMDHQVNSYTTGQQRYPAVAQDSDGNFVIVWESYGSPGTDSDYSIQGQRYDYNGLPQGSQFQVNSYTTSAQRYPAVALDSNGDFVVVWESNGSSVAGPGGPADASSSSIQGQRYNSSGAPQGSQFQINSYTTNSQRNPAVTLDSDGDFVVVWQSNGSGGDDANGYSIQGQRYDSSGAPQGSQFQVNNYTTGSQRTPAVSLDSDGDVVVVWESLGGSGSDTSYHSIQGQRYNNAGTAQGSQFQVNSYTTGSQSSPAVSRDSDGDFVVVWMSNGSSVAGPGGPADTSSGSIQGQRYNSVGTAQGSQFQVNSYTTNLQSAPAVSRDSDGDFVVVWASLGSNGDDASYASIQGQRYNNSGAAQGLQFQVNNYTTNSQYFPAVSLDSNGDFIVVWQSNGLTPPLLAPLALEGRGAGGEGAPLAPEDDSDYAIAAARFTALGGPQPTAITLQSTTLLAPRSPLFLFSTLATLLTALLTALFRRRTN